uniref:tRNA:m(4)X modification enzyme TRM13 n=1 Tax=Syphacia muris TaxID=451379 RepID=A0A0N5AI45_9BILA
MDVTDEVRCAYILPKKGRRCKMLVKKGKKYCGEHEVHDDGNEHRIYCPNDPKHTVCETRLAEHLKKCNARTPNDPWVGIGLNSSTITSDSNIYLYFYGCRNRKFRFERRQPIAFEICTTSFTATFASDTEVSPDFLIERIHLTYSSIIDKLYNWIGCGTDVCNELVGSSITSFNKIRQKQLLQHFAIIGCAMRAGLITNENELCIVDFGSGKAELPYWISKKFEKCRFLLLDNKGENPGICMERVRCSIEHFDMSKIKTVKEAKRVVGISKHLCGQATDWSINCIQNSLNNNVNIIGFALTPCCHHKSTYAEYVGKAFLSSVGFVAEQHFQLLKYIASWAVCGFSSDPSRKAVDQNKLTEVQSKNTLKKMENLTNEEKQVLGRKAKVLLEFGRAKHIQEFGYDVKLCQYVDLEISPENLLIIGKKKPF